MGRYSKQCFQLPELTKLLAMTPDGCPVALVPSRQIQRRLQLDEINRLVIMYAKGETVNELAKQFSIHRTTVLAILRRADTPLRTKMDEQQLKDAIELYESGLSLKKIAVPLGVDPETVRRALKKAGVQMRGPTDRWLQVS